MLSPLLSSTNLPLVVVVAAVAAPPLFLFLSFQRNLARAKRVGLPIIPVPFPPGLFSFFATLIFQRLGLYHGRVRQWLNMGRPGGYETHARLGDCYLTVNPLGITLVTADPEIIGQITSRRSEFPKPPNTGEIIKTYGPNVINTDGDVWRLHRKVTGKVFGEKTHATVWTQAAKQANLLLESLPGKEANNLEDSLLRLGLNVITSAAYGYDLGWDSNPPCSVSTNLSFRQAMEQLTAHLMPIYLVPHWLLRLAKAESHWGRAWQAYSAFGGYMRGMLEDTRRHPDRENLLSALLEGTDDDRQLRDDEVMGNCFIVLFAGHETTANTLHYSLLSLAANQEIQRMVLEEVDAINQEAKWQGRELRYEEDFFKAKRILAVMNETLRMFPPAGMINKWSVDDTTVKSSRGSFTIPRHTRISINATAVHLNPRIWGHDVDKWNPVRWLVDDDDRDARDYNAPSKRSASKSISQLDRDRETLYKADRGTHLPFSEGSRACSGKKFAMVEFVSVICALLRDHRVELGDGWTPDRLHTTLKGRKAGAVTLQPPERIPIRFTKR